MSKGKNPMWEAYQKEIADDHYISIHTVRTHIRSIYEKLEVHTRTEAINKVWGDNNIGN